tara:strand:+ start:16067 stop:16561 length:495 start_codon:yes stop_codon:yes gene_type:complete
MSETTVDTQPINTVETPRDKRVKLMSSGAEYRNSTPHQVAALTWSVVELVDATVAQTEAQAQAAAAQAAIDVERNALLARSADIAAAALNEQRTANLMAFYATNPNDYPEGVRDQIKALLGIASTEPDAPAAIEPEPAPVEPRSNVTSISDARREFEEEEESFE